MKYQEMDDEFEELLEALKEKHFLQNNANKMIQKDNNYDDSIFDDDFQYYERMNNNSGSSKKNKREIIKSSIITGNFKLNMKNKGNPSSSKIINLNQLNNIKIQYLLLYFF